MNPIVLQLILNGAGQASAGLNGVGGAGQNMGAQVGRGAQNAQNSLRSLAGGFRSMASSMSGSLSGVGSQLNALAGRVDAVATRIRVARSAAVARLGGAENVQRIQAGGAQAVGMGAGMMGVGLGMGAVIMSGANDAGTVERIRGGFKTSLGSDAAASGMLEEVKKFDAKSPFSFEGSAKGTQQLLAMGVEAKKVMPIMNALGDAVGAAGGGSEEFEGAIRAIGQMTAKGKLSMEEMNQLAERGIPALTILAEKMKWTQQQKADFMAGTLSVDADTGIEALRAGLSEKYKGGMDQQAATLPGQIETMKGAFFQLSAALGQYLLPPIKFVTTALTGLANFFTNLPAPIQAIIAYGGGALALFLLLGGAFVMVAGFAAMNIVNLMTLAGALGLSGGGALAAAAAFFCAPIPPLLACLVPIGLIAIAVVGFAAAAKWGADAASQSASELKNHWTGLGSFWVLAGDLLEKIWNHPLLSWLHGGSNKEAGDDAEAESLRLTNERRKKRGQKALESQSGKENEDEYKDHPKETPAAPKNPPASATPPTLPGMPPTPVMPAPSSLPGAGMGALAVAPTGPQNDMEALQDEVARGAKKYDPNSAKERLRLARRADKHQNEAEREAERERKAKEREDKKTARFAKSARDRYNKSKADLEIARMESDYDLKAEGLKGQRQTGKGADNRALDREINRLKAEKVRRKAAIRAQYDDGFAEMGGEGIAEAKAKAIEGRSVRTAKGTGGGGSLSSAMASLRAGSNIFGGLGAPVVSGGGDTGSMFNPISSQKREVYDLAGNRVENQKQAEWQSNAARDAYNREIGAFSRTIGAGGVGAGGVPIGSSPLDAYNSSRKGGKSQSRELTVNVPFNGQYAGLDSQGGTIIKINGTGRIVIPYNDR